MKAALIMAAVFAAGVAIGALFSAAYIRHLRRKIRALRGATEGKTPARKVETTKLVIWVCLLNGFAWVWFSYILAALDKMQIAESLSQVALTEIIASVLAYCIKSAVENLSKNNHWPDKPPAQATPPQTDQEGQADAAAGGGEEGAAC